MNAKKSKKHTQKKHGGIVGKLRNYFMAGILVTAPISITIYLGWLFITFVDDRITPLIPKAYNPENYLPFAVPGIGVVVLIIALMLIGALTAGFVGRIFNRVSARIMDRVPVLRGVYKATRQIFETILAKQSNAFREAVLVEYPRKGMWVIAFITGSTKGEVQAITDDDLINVFVPTTPNPTSGFLIFVPKSDILPLAMNVEDALKMVISGGIVTPADSRQPNVPNLPDA